MKKRIVSMILLLTGAIAISALLAGCGNYTMTHETNFDKAIIRLPSGETVSGSIKSWTTYNDTDIVQVTVGETTYLTSSENVVLISNESDTSND